MKKRICLWLGPGLLPAYLYGSLGFLLFFLDGKDWKPLLTWKQVQEHMIWGC